MSWQETGERQVATTLDGIRADHLARYRWAASRLQGKRVVDAACGVGYGAKILADAGCTVRAYDRSDDAIRFAQAHYNHDPGIDYLVGDLYTVAHPQDYDAVVCFEALEHVAHPEEVLARFRAMAPTLLVSVPNEEKFPYRPNIRFHHRHYTRNDLNRLLETNGWRVREWWGQDDMESEVEEGAAGRTLIAVAERVDTFALPEPSEDAELQKHALPGRPLPTSVAIVAMGASARNYMHGAINVGGRHRFVDEVWAINLQGGIIQADRVFAMDDIFIQLQRAGENPDGGIAGLLDWMQTAPGPIYTSRKYEEWPNTVEFPLEWVINRNDHVGYYNNTVPYAFAFAMALGTKAIHLYGCDYSYDGANHAHKRERGRACLEHWMGFAQARGVTCVIPGETSLMDANDPVLYGYDTEFVQIVRENDRYMVSRAPRPPEEIPTAKEMEIRYSHDTRIDHLAHRAKEV